MLRQVLTINQAMHSCSNRGHRNFAANVGIEFKTPEEFFLHEPPQPFTRDFDPSIYLHSATSTSLDASPFVIAKKNSLDLVLFCGSPGSGKSTFYQKYLQPLGYQRVNQDILKTVRNLTTHLPYFFLLINIPKRDKCLKVASTHLTEGISVAVGKLKDCATPTD